MRNKLLLKLAGDESAAADIARTVSDNFARIPETE